MSRRRSLPWLCLALSSLLLQGCITVRLSGPEPADVRAFNQRNLRSQPADPAQQPADQRRSTLVQPRPGARIIIIGHVRAIKGTAPAAATRRYQDLIRQLGLPTEQQPGLDWFLASSAGQTQVEVAGMPTMSSEYHSAEVPRDLYPALRFSDMVGAGLVGDTGDLVAAELLPGLGLWVTRVLCREAEPGFGGCEARFQRGLFQSSDGREIDRHWRLVSAGGRIDLNSYAALQRRVWKVPPQRVPHHNGR